MSQKLIEEKSYEEVSNIESELTERISSASIGCASVTKGKHPALGLILVIASICGGLSGIIAIA